MPKYRKKPVIIEAFQITDETLWDNHDWPNWLHLATKRGHYEIGSFFRDRIKPEFIYLQTLEGPLTVTMGDYIIQGVKGELYPCKPDIFHATYEPFEALPDLSEATSEE